MDGHARDESVFVRVGAQALHKPLLEEKLGGDRLRSDLKLLADLGVQLFTEEDNVLRYRFTFGRRCAFLLTRSIFFLRQQLL